MLRTAAGFCCSLALFAAQPVFAAQAADDLAAVKSCVAKEEKTPAACVGSISGPCEAAEATVTTEASLACVGRETDAWDALLNERYKAEMAAAESTDADLKTMPDGNWEPVAASLKEAQRLWIGFRDAECDRRFALFQTGSYRLDTAAACRLQLTAERALNIAVSQN